jgi:hypothetical protein
VVIVMGQIKSTVYIYIRKSGSEDCNIMALGSTIIRLGLKSGAAASTMRRIAQCL